MNHKQKIRLVSILGILISIGIALSLILYALKLNINLFYTPTQLSQNLTHLNQVVRLGGYVQDHSVQYAKEGDSVSFNVTDRTHSIKVLYHGLLPNLFREGQVVVVTGKLSSANVFIASQVLAKHDEKYIPRTVADELKKQGAQHAT